jgi:hypothetical protein
VLLFRRRNVYKVKSEFIAAKDSVALLDMAGSVSKLACIEQG